MTLSAVSSKRFHNSNAFASLRCDLRALISNNHCSQCFFCMYFLYDQDGKGIRRLKALIASGSNEIHLTIKLNNICFYFSPVRFERCVTWTFINCAWKAWWLKWSKLLKVHRKLITPKQVIQYSFSIFIHMHLSTPTRAPYSALALAVCCLFLVELIISQGK